MFSKQPSNIFKAGLSFRSADSEGKTTRTDSGFTKLWGKGDDESNDNDLETEFRSDSYYIATGDDKGIVKVWSFRKDDPDCLAHCMHTTRAHLSGVTSLAWRPTNEETGKLKDARIATASWDRLICLWAPWEKELSPEEEKIQGKDVPWEKHIRSIPDTNRHVHVKGGRLHGVPHMDCRHEKCIHVVQWRPHHFDLLTCSEDGKAKLWDVSGINRPRAGNHKDQIKECVEAKAVFHDQKVGHRGAVNMASFSRSGHRVATCGEDKSINLWNGDNGSHILRLPGESGHGHQAAIWTAAWHKSSRFILSASEDETARVWDVSGPQVFQGDHKGPVFGAVWNEKEHFQFASFSADCTCKIWDTRDGSITHLECAISLEHHQSGVQTVEFGQVDPYKLVTASLDMSALVYDLRMPKSPQYVLVGHRGIVWQASFSNDDRHVLTCSEDASARLWNIENSDMRPRPHNLIDEHRPHQQAVTCARFRMGTEAERQFSPTHTSQSLQTVSTHTEV